LVELFCVNAQNSAHSGTSGYTPLHYAARAGKLKAAQLLIQHGAMFGELSGNMLVNGDLMRYEEPQIVAYRKILVRNIVAVISQSIAAGVR
jgi:ankyrin repeat protein